MADEKSMLGSLKDYLKTCPLLEGEEIYEDCFPDGEGYAVGTLSGEPVYKQYADGRALKQFWFTLGARTLYKGNPESRIDGSAGCEYLEQWLEEQSRKEILPELEIGTPVRIDTVKGGSMIAKEAGYTEYQMQCRLIYFNH